jgi:mono/diheme cytochrome c family protein
MQKMSQVRAFLIFIVVAASALILVSHCGSGTESGKVFAPGQGHPEGWASPFAIGRTDFHATIIKEVQSTANGPVLFSLRCALCHGNNAAGKIGPNIRGTVASPTTPAFITGAINAIPLMRGQADLSQGDIQDIADYIATLRDGSPPVSTVIAPALCTACHSADLDGGISGISCFSCHNGPDGSVGHPAGWGTSKADPVHFHARYGRDFLDACRTCHGINLNLIIMPSGTSVTPCSACHNGVIAPVLTFP